MTGNDLVRAWKDPDERGDREHPSGEIQLDTEFVGGEEFKTENLSTIGCCGGLTSDWDTCVGWTKVVTCALSPTICLISYAAGC